ncbi:MAG: polynucleotide adenylyltransferase PcnB [Sandaracinaceae bacterium]
MDSSIPEAPSDDAEAKSPPKRKRPARRTAKADAATAEAAKAPVRRSRKKTEDGAEPEPAKPRARRARKTAVEAPDEAEKPKTRRTRKKVEATEEPAKPKARRTRKKAEDTQEEPPKPKARRSRKKAEDTPEEPPKPKARRARSKATEAEEPDKPKARRSRKKAEDTPEEPPKPKARRTRKKPAEDEHAVEAKKPRVRRARKTAEQDASLEDDKPKARPSRKKADEATEADEAADTVDKPKARRTRKKANDAPGADAKPKARRSRKKVVDAPPEAEEPAKPKARRTRKKSEEAEAEDKPKARRSRKKADEATEEQDAPKARRSRKKAGEATEEQDAPKARRSRKKAGEAEETESVPKARRARKNPDEASVAETPEPSRRRDEPSGDSDEEARRDEERRERRRGRRSRRRERDEPTEPIELLRPRDPNAPEPEVHAARVRTEDMDVDALKVIRRLRRHGHDAYLVGGCVRDLLLDAHPKDFDIATSARPPEVKALFRNCRVIGRRFRLAHVLFGGGKIIEVATFRRDPSEEEKAEGDSALRRSDADLLIKQDNVFGEPHEDAYRRDFTINGLFFDNEDQTVIDYVGGMDDVRNRVVRTIGPPDVRFREDPVRIMRAIKFSARLDLGIHPDTYDAMVAQSKELARAARPRLLEEILRLLRGGAAHRSFWILWEVGALGVLIPQLAVHLDDDSVDARRLWARLKAIDTLKAAGTLPSDAVLFAAVLLGPIRDAMHGAKDSTKAYEALMTEVLETLAVPRRMKERMRNVVHSQRRLEAGKLGSLPRRDYFHDAATLFEVECDARGERRPDWLDDLPPPRPDAPREPRRRRRRRRSR